MEIIEVNGVQMERSSEEDLPAPPGFAQDWTPEQQEAYDAFLYSLDEPGGIEWAVRHIDTTLEDLEAAVRVMSAIRRCSEDYEDQNGIRAEFWTTPAPELQNVLQRRLRAEQATQADPDMEYTYYWYDHLILRFNGDAEKVGAAIDNKDFDTFMAFKEKYNNREEGWIYFPDKICVFDDSGEIVGELDVNIRENFNKITYHEYECG